MTNDPRDAALAALKAVRRSGVFAEAAADSAFAGLSQQDRQLATRLVFGVIQNRTYIDWCLREVTDFGKLEPQVLDILRLGVYQIIFLDKIPESAAVNEAVKQAKRASPRAAGLVNAVLRKITGYGGMPEPPGSGAEYISVRYSLPLWFTVRICDVLGYSGCTEFAKASNEVPPVTLHGNPLKGFDPEGLRPHPWLDGAYEITGSLEKLEQLKAGRLLVADAASELVVRALGPRPGERIWDCCAAPGGKTLLAAFKMGGVGDILASDISAQKLERLEKSAKLYSAGIIRTCSGDARELHPGGVFDGVLCDVPCSGFGVLRKKPDIRFKKEEDIVGLPEIQLSILRGASRFVAPGGRLVYSTCTVLPEENSGVCDAFLKEHPEFSREGFELPSIAAPEGEVTLWPHIHGTDGFYMCRMRRAQPRGPGYTKG